MVGLGGEVGRGVVGGDDGGERSGVSSCRRNGRRLRSSTGTRGGILEGYLISHHTVECSLHQNEFPFIAFG